MKKITLLLIIGLLSSNFYSQSKNFIDQPFLETEVEIDTSVTPDKIYLTIVLNEEDNRNKKSTEELERSMLMVLKSLNIDIDKNLSLLDFSSDFKKYFLSSQQVLKSKMYSLLVNDARKAGEVLAGLEKVEISNVSIAKTEYSKSEELIIELKTRAIAKAKRNAEKMLNPLNQKLGKAIFISDTNTPSITSQLQGKVAGVQIRGVSSLYGSRAQEEMMIDFEKIEFSSKVKVTFIIE
ncbi:SIMPL domain-containing protein [Zunongwangia sp. F363]|uniref:SIMPL domain-containing protein n=1 Tax=Autumnicola tepida TaxID=3075595 RepID=A0ABU3CG99_9FLAO|nr:SIMPL domain-containing protein [Zunongwangia sp. F363]MDT0645025.1 SIMPL domain-containing protein [Zunongwangia sp. F363]